MIGEKALGEKLAKRVDEYAAAWNNTAAQTPPGDARHRALLVAVVLQSIANAIRDVTQ